MLSKVKILHLEPTDVCQLACPMCARETDLLFDESVKNNLTIDQILKVFPEERIKNLDKMFMCGNYGDPAAGKNTLEIYRYFRSVNHSITLGMNTNGSLQNSTWWAELASIMLLPSDYVVFSIDGLEDTNSIYRVGTNWAKLISNVSAFIAAGGSAHWDMLIYKHNEHQVAQCIELAKSLGFSWFRAKVSRRGFTDTLEAPVTWASPTKNIGPISCQALNEKSLYMDATGKLRPCCWIGGSRKFSDVSFQSLKDSWQSNTPNPICAGACSTSSNNVSTFAQQWKYEIQLR